MEKKKPRRVTRDIRFFAISLNQQATQKNWGRIKLCSVFFTGSDNWVQSAIPPRVETQEFLPPLPSRIRSLQQKSLSVTSVTLQNWTSVQMDRRRGWSASDTMKSQMTLLIKVNSAERTINLRFLLQKLVSRHLINCLTLIHSCFRKSVVCMCAGMKVHSRDTYALSNSFNRCVGFYAVSLSKKWGGG